MQKYRHWACVEHIPSVYKDLVNPEYRNEYETAAVKACSSGDKCTDSMSLWNNIKQQILQKENEKNTFPNIRAMRPVIILFSRCLRHWRTQKKLVKFSPKLRNVGTHTAVKLQWNRDGAFLFHTWSLKKIQRKARLCRVTSSLSIKPPQDTHISHTMTGGLYFALYWIFCAELQASEL